MLYTKLKQMQEKPGMFPCENAGDILTYIEGYNGALIEHNLKDVDSGHFAKFNDFVKNHYNIASTHANWAMMITYHSANGQDSYKQFFELLAKFQNQ
jgi:hypothetical protein